VAKVPFWHRILTGPTYTDAAIHILTDLMTQHVSVKYLLT
jgi:hypothetical protein